MTVRNTIIVWAFALVTLAPVPANAQLFNFSGTIVPEACRCENIVVPEREGESEPTYMKTAPAYGCVLQTIQNVIRFAIALGFVLALFAIMYAGFVWMTAGANAEKRTQGKNVLLSTILGLFVMLGAWLIVDFVMKTLYREPTEFGPWNNILAANGASSCIVPRHPNALADGTVNLVLDIVGGGQSGGGFNGQGFTYQSGIQAQNQHASGALAALLRCMDSRLPDGVGQISSISDTRIVEGQKTFQQCIGGGCGHGANSCHYGGRSCTGQSHAVDFGDEQNWRVIAQAAQQCGASGIYHPGNDPQGHGDHVHVSVQGGQCGCS